MAQTNAPGVRTATPLIERDRGEGSAVYDPNGNRIGTIKRLATQKLSGRIAYAVMAFGGFPGLGEEERTIPWNKLTYDTGLGGYRTGLTEDPLWDAPSSRHRDYDWLGRQRERERHYRYSARYYGGGGP
ncbi:PRC-barrel domain-containing protein [Microvirga massiliensis]|uniref:PRC-barrel domain-containing protein n=1 Tax=Microvirga massiliensis TaxID=1033741 RepID=UPI00062B39B1|nr:PRC-barrel domain-containing protein [Microvirga massiliensis]